MTAVQPARVLRVGHSAVVPGVPLSQLRDRLDGAGWDMVELDVLRADARLVVAHDASDLALPVRLDFADALAALRDCLASDVRIDVDVKATGYESAVAEAIAAAQLSSRVLVSTMEPSSLAVFRRIAPELRLGLSVPRARRDYLAHPLGRFSVGPMLAWLRRTLPARVGRALDAGATDAIMAHWSVVTPRLVESVCGRDAELFVWTVDDPVRLPQLVALGVSGVITNRPDLFD